MYGTVYVPTLGWCQRGQWGGSPMAVPWSVWVHLALGLPTVNATDHIGRLHRPMRGVRRNPMTGGRPRHRLGGGGTARLQLAICLRDLKS